MDRPQLIVHADWGSDPRKRWMCVANLDGSVYVVGAPELVGDLADFWERVARRADGKSLLVGFDFPIGLPKAQKRLGPAEQIRRLGRALLGAYLPIILFAGPESILSQRHTV
jgi:hypothetical protein